MPKRTLATVLLIPAKDADFIVQDYIFCINVAESALLATWCVMVSVVLF